MALPALKQRESIDSRLFRQYMQGVNQRFATGSFRAIWPDVNEVVELSIQENFMTSTTPDGEPWRPRAERTQDYRLFKDESISYDPAAYVGQDYKRIEQEGPLLIMTSRMLQSATRPDSPEAVVEMNDRDYERGTDVEYAARHNYGDGRDRKKGGIPQREFMGAREDDLEEIDDIIADYGLTFFMDG